MAKQALLDAGVDINNQNDTGAASLMYAASSGKDELVALLLARGADALTLNQDGSKAIDMAASIG